MTIIKDIAKKTGLSLSTVSLVLNEKDARISEKTKKMVLEAAKELNYRPNMLAVGLATKKTKTIGLIIPDISNLFFSELAKAVELEASSQNYNVIFCNTNDDSAKDIEFTNVLLGRSIDGIIMALSSKMQPDEGALLSDTLSEYKTPAVIVDRLVNELDAISILLDYRRGGYLATRHLIEMGHRDIGCITGPLTLTNACERFEGYKQALNEYHIPFRAELVFEGNYYSDGGFEGAAYLIPKQVTAIFACNDMMAYGAYKQLKNLGLKIPDDISVVGFDDIPFSEFMDVPLTTIRQPVSSMGQEACRQLLGLIDLKRSRKGVMTFEPILKIRQSTGRKQTTGFVK